MSASRLRQSSAHPSAVADREYAFEMACSNIRYGEGVTREVGMDLENLGVRNVCILTDKNVCPELCMYSIQLCVLPPSIFFIPLSFLTLPPFSPYPPFVSPSPIFSLTPYVHHLPHPTPPLLLSLLPIPSWLNFLPARLPSAIYTPPQYNTASTTTSP